MTTLCTFNTNPKLANFSVQLFNDDVHDTTVNMTLELFAFVTKMMTNLRLALPESGGDKDYRREFFKVTIDMNKFFKGNSGNFMSNALMENFNKSIDFEPKFPMKKVINAVLFVTLNSKIN